MHYNYINIQNLYPTGLVYLSINWYPLQLFRLRSHRAGNVATINCSYDARPEHVRGHIMTPAIIFLSVSLVILSPKAVSNIYIYIVLYIRKFDQLNALLQRYIMRCVEVIHYILMSLRSAESFQVIKSGSEKHGWRIGGQLTRSNRMAVHISSEIYICVLAIVTD